MNEENVQFGELVNATVKVNNLNHTERVHDILAEVTVNGTDADTFNNGEVKSKDGESSLGTFSCYGVNLNINFDDSSDVDACTDILKSVLAFIADVRTKVQNGQALAEL